MKKRVVKSLPNPEEVLKTINFRSKTEVLEWINSWPKLGEKLSLANGQIYVCPSKMINENGKFWCLYVNPQGELTLSTAPFISKNKNSNSSIKIQKRINNHFSITNTILDANGIQHTIYIRLAINKEKNTFSIKIDDLENLDSKIYWQIWNDINKIINITIKLAQYLIANPEHHPTYLLNQIITKYVDNTIENVSKLTNGALEVDNNSMEG